MGWLDGDDGKLHTLFGYFFFIFRFLVASNFLCCISCHLHFFASALSSSFPQRLFLSMVRNVLSATRGWRQAGRGLFQLLFSIDRGCEQWSTRPGPILFPFYVTFLRLWIFQGRWSWDGPQRSGDAVEQGPCLHRRHHDHSSDPRIQHAGRAARALARSRSTFGLGWTITWRD